MPFAVSDYNLENKDLDFFIEEAGGGEASLECGELGIFHWPITFQGCQGPISCHQQLQNFSVEPKKTKTAIRAFSNLVEGEHIIICKPRLVKHQDHVTQQSAPSKCSINKRRMSRAAKLLSASAGAPPASPRRT
ncbi:Coiled-Coil Domain-Containing Protein 43 [Manis pentadactyla]|nr:Coiled-Coil Domain-Containing Protein 43 [Manis pentadactyla]